MLGIAYAALLLSGAVASLVGFATLGVRELTRDAAADKVRANKLVWLLAQRRGQFVSFFLNDGKSVAGRVAFVDSDELLVHIDIRKQKRDARGRLMQHEEPPQTSHLAPVELRQVRHIEHVTEEYGDADDDFDPDARVHEDEDA